MLLSAKFIPLHFANLILLSGTIFGATSTATKSSVSTPSLHSARPIAQRSIDPDKKFFEPSADMKLDMKNPGDSDYDMFDRILQFEADALAKYIQKPSS
jgi:hypothetical protein